MMRRIVMGRCEERKIVDQKKVTLSADRIEYSDGIVEFKFETDFLPPLKLAWGQLVGGPIAQQQRQPTYEIEPTNPQDFWDQVIGLPWNPVPDANGDIKCQLVKATRGSQIVPECRGGCPGGSGNCSITVYGRGNRIGAKCECL